jgi:uncharacterized membrane protein
MVKYDLNLISYSKNLSLKWRAMKNKTIFQFASIMVVWNMVFNTIFNNISVISWRSVLLVEETLVPRENHRPVASYCQRWW